VRERKEEWRDNFYTVEGYETERIRPAIRKLLLAIFILLNLVCSFSSHMTTSPKSFLHTQGEHSLPAELFLNTNQGGQLLAFVVVWASLYSDTAVIICIEECNI